MSELMINLQEINPHIVEQLQEEADRRDLEIGQLLLQLIQAGLKTMHQEAQPTIYQDLDSLVGTWEAQEVAEFKHHLAEMDRGAVL